MEARESYEHYSLIQQFKSFKQKRNFLKLDSISKDKLSVILKRVLPYLDH